MSREQAETLRQVDANLTRHRSRRSHATAHSAWRPSAELRRIVREAAADGSLLNDLAAVHAPLVADEGDQQATRKQDWHRTVR